jgi:hypothetical protein
MPIVRSIIAVLAVLAGGVAVQNLADIQHASAATVVPAADTPSPTLGSTPQPGVNPPDDNDGDANDWTQPWLGVAAPLTIAVLVGGSLAIYLTRRSRRKTTRR